ncbi:MAG: DHH family phosphoesterase [Candidatus Gastranaerophilales bacterium]|nr:DHH family phosphoesterase [Candidatus Gastranaerophilales bacterium]
MKITPITIGKQSFGANPISKEQAEHINKKLQNADTVDIFCHTSTDDDSFNSAKVLYEYLEKQGKSPRIITAKEPDNYEYDPSKFNILNFDKVDEFTQKADVAACVDFSKEERMAPNVLNYFRAYDAKDVVGFDHHNESTKLMPNYRQITAQYKSVADMPVEKPQNYYIDSSSKSCSAIMYRFFEALNEPLSKPQLKSVFCGMSDDMSKAGYLKFLNKFSTKFTHKLGEDDNTKEVFKDVTSKLNKKDMSEVISHLDVLATLSPKEKAFQKRLFDSVKFSDNKKFAYVELGPQDPQWMALGGDNKRTSVTLRDFRVRLLNNDSNDKMISKDLRKDLKDVQAVAVFYSNPDEDLYKISIHTKEDYAKKYNEYIRENIYPELTAGGHANRGGGRTFTLDSEKCHEWVGYFKTAADNIDYKE